MDESERKKEGECEKRVGGNGERCKEQNRKIIRPSREVMRRGRTEKTCDNGAVRRRLEHGKKLL